MHIWNILTHFPSTTLNIVWLVYYRIQWGKFRASNNYAANRTSSYLSYHTSNIQSYVVKNIPIVVQFLVHWTPTTSCVSHIIMALAIGIYVSPIIPSHIYMFAGWNIKKLDIQWNEWIFLEVIERTHFLDFEKLW